MITVLSMAACNSKPQGDVIIHTEFGDMVIVLYDETPQHKANFLKLVKEGYYDDLIFHRVISNFMIQGGDPESRNASPDAQLGSGGPDYTVEAEFVPKYIHKKGALAAARQGDNVNPQKRSSGSQFYIVQGQPYTEEQLNGAKYQAKLNEVFMDFIYKPENANYLNRLAEAQRIQDQNAYMKVIEEIEPTLQAIVDADDSWKYTDEQVEIYSTIGGTPHLDGQYTVFGEVIEGLDVIDTIAEARTGNRGMHQDVPTEAIVIKKATLK